MRRPYDLLGAALIVVGLFVPAMPCAALDPAKAIGQYSRDAWTTAQGLPQGSVLAIAQTRDGYLWLGTRAGLARFDGASFTVFDPATAPGLEGRTIQSLHAAPDGSLWIGTDGKGVTRYDGTFRTLGADLGLEGESGNGLYVDGDGVLWIAGWSGVVSFDGRRARRVDVSAGLPHDSVFAVTGDGRGTVWAATAAGLAEIHAGRLVPVGRDVRVAEPQCLLFDSKGVLWVGSAAGLDRIAGREVRHFTTSDGLLANFVTALAEDRHGGIWVGTEGGLNRWSAGRFDGFSSADGLPGDAVASLMEDAEGSLWVGLRGSGLVRFREGSLTTYTRREGLAGDNVTCVFQSSDGSLWIGTTHGLTRLREGRMRVFTRRDGLLNDSITGLGEAPGLGVLVASYARRLAVFRGGRFAALPGLTIASTIPSVIHSDGGGALWVGTLGVGLYRLSGARAERHPFADSAGRHVIYAVHEDAGGALWFATPNGVVRHEGGRFTNVEVYRQGQNLGVAFALHGDAEANLWVATRDRGLCRIREGATRACYGRAQGLLDDTVLSVLEDDRGRLFLGTPRGICVVARRDLDAFDGREILRIPALSLGVQDGMMTAECAGTRWPAAWKAKDGRIWFPTAKGVVVADPDAIGVVRPAPPVLLEEVTIDGVSRAHGQPVSAPPGRGEIEIAYAGLAFRAPELVRFRYRLDGFDRDWVDAGARRVARYTNIAPGRYRFRVTAAQEGGAWNEREASVPIVLAPHFYETRGWYAVLLALGASVAWIGYRWRVRRLRQRAEGLARSVSEALAHVKVLSGLLPICASCKRIRSDMGYWEQIEAYIRDHSEARFSHGLCPSCVRLLYPELADKVLGRDPESQA